MKTLNRKWFEVGVRYAKVDEQGIAKPVTEIVAVDAHSFGEAETSAEEAYSSMGLEHEVISVKLATYKEAVLGDDSVKDTGFYKVKVKMITFDEKTEKEKKTSVWFLVMAETLQKALLYIDEVMKDSMQEYEKATGTETRIVDMITKEH